MARYWYARLERNQRVEYENLRSSRQKQYRYLRQNNFVHSEAFRIVNAKTKYGKLQKLNLNNKAWQETIADRQKYIGEQLIRFMNKGLTIREARKAIDSNIELYYSKNTKDKGFDWIKEYYKIDSKPKGDFIQYKEARQLRYKVKGMPYRTKKRLRYV